MDQANVILNSYDQNMAIQISTLFKPMSSLKRQVGQLYNLPSTKKNEGDEGEDGKYHFHGTITSGPMEVVPTPESSATPIT